MMAARTELVFSFCTASRIEAALVKEWAFHKDGCLDDFDYTLEDEATVHDGQLSLPSRAAAFISSPISISLRSGVTLEAAVQLSNRTCASALITLRDASSNPGASVSLLLDASHWAVLLSGSDTPHKFDARAPETVTSEPLHLVLVVEPCKQTTCRVRCFRNGKPLGSLVRSIPAADSKEKQLILGNRDRESNKYTGGLTVFCSRVYREALTEQQFVKELYQRFLGALKQGHLARV